MNLFLELRRHGKLAAQRHPMYEKNKFGKFWMYLMAIFWIGYLIFFGSTFAFALADEAKEPYHILNSGLIFILLIDFLMRFPFQKTPTQEVKPYLLLPVKRNRLVDFLLIRSGLSSFNIFWLFFFVPFAIFSVARFYGITGVLTYSIGIWLLMVLNNYWFLLCRTLMSERIWWVALPIVVYGGIGAALFIPDNSPVFDWFTDLGEGFITGNALTFLIVLAIIAILWYINSRVIRTLIYNELNKVEDTTVQVKTLSEYRFLDRYGQIGEYIRLELKMILRNKMCRKSLISVCCVVVAFSALIGFSDIYTGGMRDFFVLYNYVIVGILFLNALMSYEGNYMDGLMSRKESIYALLRAKYILYTLSLLFPFLLTIPGMIAGKISVLQSLAWMCMTAGPVYFALFEAAAYNNRTIGLNTKMTNRQNMGTGLQNMVGTAAFFVPYLIAVLLQLPLGKTGAQWAMIAIGLGLVLTSRWWIKDVYRRFMRRRYKNMEGFRDSRQR